MSRGSDDDIDPFDEIDEEEVPINEQVQEVLDFYDCADLLPFIERIVWLNTVKEALGYIPVSHFQLNYEEIVALTILIEENQKKMQHDNLNLRRESREAQSRARAGASGPTPKIGKR